MTTVVDVAAYVLQRCGTMTTMKLQKLVFYVQAEFLAYRGYPLFQEDFQAWRGGPVCRELFTRHRGMFLIRPGELAAPNADNAFTNEERCVIDAVCDKLSSLTGNELSLRTHNELPWKTVRGDLAPAAACTDLITKQSMKEFYSTHPILP